MLKIATWNINSVRARQERLVAWLEREQPDVLCLQEIKTTEGDFPYAAVEAAGYEAAVSGQKTYNGVAILSRTPLKEEARSFDDGVADEQARFLAAEVAGLHVLSLYVPNGGTPASDAFTYKLEWLGRLRRFLERTYDRDDPVLLCGDFNVAPEDRDVARPEEWRGSVLCHDAVREALAGVMALGFTDTVRLHDAGPGPYSWWDYRNLAFQRGNGLRIDHVFATAPVATRCREASVQRDERKGDKPSDHAPVVAVFD